jgi:subtilisin family serine protease
MKTIRLLPIVLATLLFFSSPDAGIAQQPDGLVRVFIELPARPSILDTALIELNGGRTRHVFLTSNTISAEVPQSALAALENSPRVLSVYPVPTVRAMEDRLDWGVDRIDAERVWGGSEDATSVSLLGNGGQDMKVAIIDTGLDRDHPDLAANIAGGYNWIGTCTTCWDDDQGHGTHVGGIVAALDNGIGSIGVAPKAKLYGLKILDAHNVGYMDDAAAAVEWASGLGGGVKADVINMSFGCSGCEYSPLRLAIEAAYANNIVLVGAAGNLGPGADTVIYPAKYPQVIAVSATASNDSLASFSSTGPRVDIAAPGAAIYSTLWNNTYATFNGTSMASPHVAGVAALIKASNTAISAPQIRERITSTATDLGSAGRDDSFGYGLVNAVAAVGPVSAPLPTPLPPTPTPVPTVPAAVHDMAVTALSAAPASVQSGTSITISATVQNQGNHSESGMTLTIRDGVSGPAIATRSISLAASASKTETVVWSTAGAATGAHDIYATVATHSGESDVADNTRSTPVTIMHVTPPPPQNTGFRNCTLTAAVRSSSGDNNGYETSPGEACTDGGSFASDNNSGTSSNSGCTHTGKDRHVFYGYPAAVPSGATVRGIEVRLDAWVDTASGTRSLCVELSWDGGVTWTAARRTPNLGRTEATYLGGSATDTWGRAWTSSEANNLRVRVTSAASSTLRDFRLDYVGVRVTYTP